MSIDNARVFVAAIDWLVALMSDASKGCRAIAVMANSPGTEGFGNGCLSSLRKIDWIGLCGWRFC
jgi:hypothetical protein